MLIIPSQCFSNFARPSQLLKCGLFTTLTTWNKTDISQIFVQFVWFSPDEKTISATIKNILITSWFLCFCNMRHLISLIMKFSLNDLVLPAASTSSLTPDYTYFNTLNICFRLFFKLSRPFRFPQLKSTLEHQWIQDAEGIQFVLGPEIN